MKERLKYSGLLILRFLLNILNIFPVKKNRIVFYSFNGKQYSCNPRRITEKLLQDTGNDLEIIWAFKNPKKFDSILPDNIKSVKYRSPLYYYYAKTSHVMVYNVQGYGEIARRKGQIFIQTWHASNGYKKVGVFLKGTKRKINLLGHKDYSYVMCGCKNMEKNRVRGSMNFQGEVIKGTPRMDSIINQDLPGMRDKVFEKLGVSTEKKIILYAPTWRDDRNENDYGLEYSIVKQSLDSRFGGDWIIAVRLHPNVYKRIDVDLPYVIDATDYPDMEELVYVVDAMISDYSSCIWDFSFTERPCFLLCTDLEKYNDVRSFDNPIETWGFPLSTSSEELAKQIMSFDADNYRNSIAKHHEEMGSYEDGNATERICTLIEKVIKE